MGLSIRDIWGGIKSAAPYVATAYGVYQGNKAQNRADAFEQRRIDMEERAYNEAAPLRAAGMAGMLRGGHDYDLEGVGMDQLNPFAATRRQRALPQRPAASPASAPSINGEALDNPFLPVADPLKTGDVSSWRNVPEVDPSTIGRRWNPTTGQYEAVTPYTGPTIYPKRGGR